MRFAGLLLAMAIALFGLYYYLKQAAPAPHQIATQAISTTGVEMDLNAIAQSERMYFVQNGAYTDLNTLVSAGVMNLARTDRDGYTYTVETSPGGFTVTAVHPDTPAGPNGAESLHYPVITVDQSMQVRQGN